MNRDLEKPPCVDIEQTINTWQIKKLHVFDVYEVAQKEAKNASHKEGRGSAQHFVLACFGNCCLF